MGGIHAQRGRAGIQRGAHRSLDRLIRPVNLPTGESENKKGTAAST